MKKLKMFKLIWKYLKKDKLKVFLYVLLVIVSYIPNLIAPYFWGKTLEYLILKDFNNFILYLGIWSAMFVVAYSLFQIPRDYLYTCLEVRFTKNVSNDLFKKSLDLPAVAFEDIGVGELINRLYTDPDRVVELLSKLIRMICKASVVVAVFVVCFKTSIILGIEVMVFAIIMGSISIFFFPKIKKSQEGIKKQSDLYVKVLTEDVTGIREIKALGIKRNIKDKVSNIIDVLFKRTMDIRKHERYYYAFNDATYFILQFIILFTCGKLFFEGHIGYSVFIMLASYIGRIDSVVESISDFGVNYNKVAVSLKRIDEILSNKLYKDEYFGDNELINNSGKITFKNVHFKYKEDEQETLKGLSLEIEPNKKVAVVGRSGNGKSTLFNLLLRYFNKTSGNILIDGVKLESISEESLRKNISIIRQSPILFNLSILDNFKLVKADATLEEVRNVCKKAYIDDYIMSLSKGYETIIGEGGVNLSGGQKQRVAIARTLLLNTKIILFDEATSALDNESQEYIKKTIDELVKDHTVIIVAHRLSTILDSDVIHVIDKGKCVASGKHSELLKKSTVYSSLYTTESLNS